ncbi:uncharacterized protein LOC135483740 [Lineus longissimus]|uniref:uncharacterized protein LOC135483740 n=1 Tax=Lineus longissimus TaxID=88925 RepID=UPI00315C8EBE
MAWNRTKRVVECYPLISETSVATKEKIYKDQRKLEDIIKKLDYQRLNVERQFDMEKRSIREELRTRVGTRTIQLDAVDLPKLRRLGLENAPRQLILTLLRAFPDLFHDTDTHLPRLSREGTGCGDVFDGSSPEENLMHGLMALVLPNREKPLTPAQSVDRLIHEKNITFMRTTNECKEQYRKEHMTFDPSLSFRQREYLRRQRSARKSARRRGRQLSLSVDTLLKKEEETEKRSHNEGIAVDIQFADEPEAHQVEVDCGESGGADNNHGLTKTEKDKKIEKVTLQDDILFEEEDKKGPQKDGERFISEVHTKQDFDSKPATSSRRLRVTPDGRKREDVLRAVGELLQRSRTFSYSAGTTIQTKLQDEDRHISKSQPTTPTNARIEKGVSLRIRQKYLHEPRRQMFIRNVTQEKVRRLERRSPGQQIGYVQRKMTAPNLIGWHTIMQNSAHMAQIRRGSGQESCIV